MGVVRQWLYGPSYLEKGTVEIKKMDILDLLSNLSVNIFFNPFCCSSKAGQGILSDLLLPLKLEETKSLKLPYKYDIRASSFTFLLW